MTRRRISIVNHHCSPLIFAEFVESPTLKLTFDRLLIIVACESYFPTRLSVFEITDAFFR